MFRRDGVSNMDLEGSWVEKEEKEWVTRGKGSMEAYTILILDPILLKSDTAA